MPMASIGRNGRSRRRLPSITGPTSRATAGGGPTRPGLKDAGSEISGPKISGPRIFGAGVFGSGVFGSGVSGSASIAAIDVDVAVGGVAGPYGRLRAREGGT